jgi:hypothetical protein
MPYTQEERESKLLAIFGVVANGESLRNALKKVELAPETFYRWIDENEEWAKQYARACEGRADAIFEDILSIADDTSADKKVINVGEDVKEVVDHEAIQRSKLRVDARKWFLSKMNPTKYGDRIIQDHTIKEQPLFGDDEK